MRYAVAMLVLSVIFMGASCKKESVQAPAGWQVYEGSSIKVAYPPGWYAKQLSFDATPNPSNLVRIVFDSKPIPEELPPEPFFPVMVETSNEPLRSTLDTLPSDAMEIEENIQGKHVLYFEYQPEIPPTTVRGYILTVDDNVIVVTGFGTNKDILKSFAEKLEVR